MRKRRSFPAILLSILSIVLVVILVGGILVYYLIFDSLSNEPAGEDDFLIMDNDGIYDIRYDGSLKEGVLYDVGGPSIINYTETILGSVVELIVTVTWTDEGNYMGYVNTPERFYLDVTLGQMNRYTIGSNEEGGIGRLVVSFNFGTHGAMSVDEVYITIGVKECGDHVPDESPLYREIEDPSNYFGMDLAYSYLP